MRLLLVAAMAAGFLSTALAGELAVQDVGVDVQVDTPPIDPPVDPPMPAPPAVCKGQRWVSYEVDIPVTVYRKELRWKLEEYDIPIPDPGPQPPNQVLSDPCTTTVDCVPCQQSSVNVDIDMPSQPIPPQPNLPGCLDGSCVRRVIGNRLQGQVQGARVNVDVDTRPRGLFWRFRR